MSFSFVNGRPEVAPEGDNILVILRSGATEYSFILTRFAATALRGKIRGAMDIQDTKRRVVPCKIGRPGKA